MKRYALIIICLLAVSEPLLAGTAGQEHPYPMTTLKNGCLEAVVLLPDPQDGYYRSTRFDWSGIIAQVTYGDHTYFQPWHNPDDSTTTAGHDPLDPASGTGTVEEFRDPLGYDQAGIGDPFLKIGVGVLERAEDKPYHFAYPYKLLKAGQWDIETKENQIRFIQDIRTEFGYAYHYEKSIVLSQTGPELTIHHSLKNTGQKDIHANPYCHNFFRLDNQFIDANYKVEFPNKINRIDDFDSRVVIKDNYIQLNQPIVDDSWVGGHIDPGGTKRYVLSNSQTATSVEVISDVDHGPFFVFMCKRSFCIEPMVVFDVKPGESFNWSRTYVFTK